MCESQNVTHRTTHTGFVGLMSSVTCVQMLHFSSLTRAVCVLQSVIMRMDSLKQRTAHLLVSRRSKRRKLQPHSSGWPPHIEGTGNRSSASCYHIKRSVCGVSLRKWQQDPQQALVNISKLLSSFSIHYFFCICFLNFTQSFFIKALFWG